VPLARKDRDSALELFDGVVDTLMELQLRGVPVVAHTDAPYTSAGNRIRISGLDGMINTVYATPVHQTFGEATDFAEVTDVRCIDNWKPKPDHTVIDSIVRRHGTVNDRTLYVGDSLRRDMSMAQAAGLIPVWARYGNDYDGRDDAITALTDVHRLRPRHASDYEPAPEVTEFASVDSFCEILDLI
jgi:phosphoglycolate phosphatase